MKRLRTGVRTAVLASMSALILAGSPPVFATPLMDMRAEDLLLMAADFRKELNLNANQQTLWQQIESRTRAVLRERQSRREKMQAAARAALEGKDVELRDLVAPIDAESATTAAEEKQLREWWLTMNDALNETQRRQVAVFLAEQLQRMPGREGGERPPQGGGEGHQRGHGGKGGMGGMGGQGGMGRGG